MIFDIRKIKELNFEALKRVDLGNTLKFDGATQYLQFISKHLIIIDSHERQLLPVEKELSIASYNRFFELITQIRAFEAKPSESFDNTIQRQKAILAAVVQFQTEFNKSVLPILNRIIWDDPRIQNILNLDINEGRVNEILLGVQGKIAQVDNIVSTKLTNFDNQLNTKLKVADDLINQASKTRKQAEDFTIGSLTQKYGTIFDNQARRNWRAAMISLVILIASLSILLVAAYRLFTPLIQQIANMQNSPVLLEYVISSLIFRLAILTIGFVFVKESLKSFNINMHMHNINKHRQNTLESFDTLIVNTQTKEVRDQIITEISQTIYSTQDDGYLHQERSKFKLSDITELIKAIR